MLIPFCALLVVLAASGLAARSASQRIIAHRGASIDAPENTLAAFRLAWEQGADGIEGDFRLTADGQIVCIHDSNTERVVGVKRIVEETTYADLETLDVGAWKGEAWRGERIPLLTEVLAIVPAGKKIFIELKPGLEIVEPVAKLLENSSLTNEQIVIIALDADVVAACKARMPNIKCHWLAHYKQQQDGLWKPSVEEVIATIRESHADGLGSEALPNVVNDPFIEKLRAAGIDEFHVWTVDDAATGRFYQQRGAWAITTNCPAKLRAAMNE